MRLKLFLCIFLISPLALSKTVLFLGDSLTEGYGVERNQAYPELVKALAKKDGITIQIINGGVSGSTTASGLQRLHWYLKMKKPDIMLLALGANDGLRGFDIQKTQSNLEKIIKTAKENKIQVILAGMLMPPNYGDDYAKKFKRIYEDLKTSQNISMIPFLLEGVAGKKDFNLPDGIHPNVEGHRKVANIVYTFIKDKL